MHQAGLGTSFSGPRALARGAGYIITLISKLLSATPATLQTTRTIFGSVLSSLHILQEARRNICSWIIGFLTVSITIESSDKLHREVMSWVRPQVLEPQGHRKFIAQSQTIQSNHTAVRGPQDSSPVRKKGAFHSQTDKKVPIEYLPIFENTWFVFESRPYLIHGTGNINAKGNDKHSSSQLVITCLDGSLSPLKRFIESCQDHCTKDSENFTQVWSTNRGSKFGSVINKPHRAMESVYFDVKVKNDLISDINKYLDPNNRRFYGIRGVPYRRGYFMDHQAPGKHHCHSL